MMIKAIAIDDEPVALSIMENFCSRDGGVSLSAYSDPVVGMDAVYRERPDLVFLDIEMNGVSGVDVARTLPEGTYLIFTTAYAQFALEGFELNAMDFLHKPFSYTRFEASLKKVRDMMALKNGAAVPSGPYGEITVKSEYRNVNVRLCDIRYIEAMDNYVKIHLSGGRDPVLTQMSMKDFADMLPGRAFARIHKSYIIPLAKVSQYTRRQVTLSCGIVLPIGRVYSAEVLSRLCP